MKKTFIFLAFLSIAALLLLLFVVLKSFQKQSPTTETTVIPTITPFIKPTNIPGGFVISTDPGSNTTGVNINKILHITFQDASYANNANVILSPSLKIFTYTFENVLFVQPQQEYLKNTSYTVKITSKNSSLGYSFRFTTGSQALRNDAPNPTFVEEQEKRTLRENPDIFLSNKLPYVSSTFAMKYFISNIDGKILFTAVLKGSGFKKSTEDAKAWMKSLGLSDQQLTALNIQYVPEATVELKNKLPHDGINFTMSYDKDLDKTSVIIYKENKIQGEQEFEDYLRSHGVEDKSWINNLTIQYF